MIRTFEQGSRVRTAIAGPAIAVFLFVGPSATWAVQGGVGDKILERPPVWQAALRNLATGLTGRDPGSTGCPVDSAAGY